MPNHKKPTALKVLQGTARKSRINPNEPTPPVAIPSCPGHLNAEAKKEWRRITKVLADQRIVTHLDRAVLAAYCQAYGTWVDAEKQLKQHGMTTTTPNGLVVQSAWLQIRNKALEQMHKYAVENGFTPVSRSRVSTLPESNQGDDPLQRFLK